MCALIELPLAMPLELSLADAADNPLPDVAAKVKQQIADAVGCLIRTPPNVLVVEHLEAPLDFRQVICPEQPARLVYEGLGDVFHSGLGRSFSSM